MGEFLIVLTWLPALVVALEYLLYHILVLAALVFRRADVPGDFQPQITIIIPAYNEEEHIQAKLADTLSISYPPDRFSVVVVDDGSEDGTREIVRKFQSQGVMLLEAGSERQGKIKALKKALQWVETPIAVCTDATVSIDRDAVSRLVRHFHDPKVGGATARMEVANRDGSRLAQAQQFLFDIQNTHKHAESNLDSVSGLFGQLMAVRPKALGDFDTDVVYEDREFGIIIRENGYRCVFEPDAVAYYLAPEQLNDFSKQKKRNIGAMTESILRHRKVLFNPRYGLYGMVIFPEYSLFRVVRSYLLGVSVLSALLYGIFFSLPWMATMLITIGLIVVLSYLGSTLLIAPMVPRKREFVRNLFTTIPILALISAYFLVASVGYFRGRYSALWDKVARDKRSS